MILLEAPPLLGPEVTVLLEAPPLQRPEVTIPLEAPPLRPEVTILLKTPPLPRPEVTIPLETLPLPRPDVTIPLKTPPLPRPEVTETRDDDAIKDSTSSGTRKVEALRIVRLSKRETSFDRTDEQLTSHGYRCSIHSFLLSLRASNSAHGQLEGEIKALKGKNSKRKKSLD